MQQHKKRVPHTTSSDTLLKKKKLDESSVLYTAFSSYQQELDTRNDKYERLVKLSRDVTIQSKRTIFSLLRKEEELSILVTDAEDKIKTIKHLLSKIAVELTGEDPYQFVRAYSPGVQEFIEAVTLLHYLKENKVMLYDEVNKLYFQYETTSLLLTPYDYMLGVADLTGELMRMAINCIGSGKFDEVDEICHVVRNIYKEFSIFATAHREITRKISVMRTSIKKIENACYVLKIRGSEIPGYMLEELASFKDSFNSDEQH